MNNQSPKLSDSEHDNFDPFSDLLLPIWFTACISYSLHPPAKTEWRAGKQECFCYINRSI